jgi:cyclic pyranopterin phosphate synthase
MSIYSSNETVALLMTPYDLPAATAMPRRPEFGDDGLGHRAPPSVQTAMRAPMVDPFARRIDYVRVSVTDRCDLRCIYCMSDHMSFLPRAEVLTIEELDRLCSAFVQLGVRKLRLTGGEPLVRKGFMELVARLSRHLEHGALEDLTLTTNGTRLAAFAADLAAHGVRRINVSLDTLDPVRFAQVTRGGDLAKVLDGLEAARAAGLAVKINTVALRQDNLDEIPDLVAWAHGQGFDLTLIETMPLGEVEGDRSDQFVSLDEVRQSLAAVWTLEPVAEGGDQRGAGPARYDRVVETGRRIGFITPLSHSFCDTCNRIRVTCTGTLHTCLGHDDATDLRGPLRASPDDAALIAAIRQGVASKPKAHDFQIAPGARPTVARHMSTTGG